MSQHFLLSATARTLSLAHIMRMTDDEARDTFKRVRWSANGGEPFCPHCGCLTVYTLAEVPARWGCKGRKAHKAHKACTAEMVAAGLAAVLRRLSQSVGL